MTRRFALLVNPVSAGGRTLELLPQITAELDQLGAEYRTAETRSTDHAIELAREAAAAGETVGALGGDGLVRPIAGALRDSSVALAILPGGRGNDFARVLGIPKNPIAAARNAVQGVERMLDVAEANGTPYIGIASFGFDSVANRIANDAKLVRGNLVYLYAGLRTLATWKPAKFTVTVDGERHEATGFSVAVGNSRSYGGGMLLLPHAELDDGMLDVLLSRRTSKLRYLRGITQVFKGKHLDSPSVKLLRGSVVEAESDPPYDVYADGDPVARTPATMTVRARCLRVIVPA